MPASSFMLPGLLTAACLLLPACSGGGPGAVDAGLDSSDGNQVGTTLCSATEDCPPKQLCLDGICYQGTPCDSDDACLEGYSCNFITNVCVPKGDCESHEDCDQPRPACLVSTGRCVECVEESHCANRVSVKHCDPTTYTCVICTQDAHCPEGYLCNQVNTCVLPPDCLEDGDCSDPLKPHCDTAAGHCRECLQDDHCPAGGLCQPDGHTCVACYSDDHCPGDRPLCDPESHECVGCLQDADCPADYDCNPYSRECSDVRCQDAEDCLDPALPHCDLNQHFCVECISMDHCSQDLWCRNYRCQAGCTSDYECVEKNGIHWYCNQDDQTCFRAECMNDSDCETFPDRPHCKESAQPPLPRQYSCVACTEDAHCPDDAVCDPADFTCQVLP